MKLYNKLTLSILRFLVVLVIIYGTISFLLTPLPSSNSSATRFTQALSKLFVYNRLRGSISDVIGADSVSASAVKTLQDLRRDRSEIERLDPACKGSQNNDQHVTSDLPFRCSHLMVLSGSRGRTGNQLFQFAALLGIAHRHNYTAYVKPTFPLLRFFDITQVADLNISGMIRLGEVKSGVYSTAVEHINVSRNYSLDGYFQSWKYFREVRDLIKKSLKLKDEYMNEAIDFMQHVGIPGFTKVCVHVRRGDIHSKAAVKQGYSVGSIDYIKRAMTYFKSKFRDIQFIALSDDKEWCSLHLKNNDTVVSPFYLTPIDFGVLTLCDHVIITTGTFGWWGAWFSSGTVIYYRDFPRPNSWLATQVNKNDYFPPKWLPMA